MGIEVDGTLEIAKQTDALAMDRKRAREATGANRPGPVILNSASVEP
jgi:hypothetical protein